VKLADLDTIPGSNCWTGLVNVGPDRLIGTIALGGLLNGGFIYELIPSTDAFAELFSFNLFNGGSLVGDAMLASDGLMYGTGTSGGTNFFGTVYRFDPITHVMTTLHSFNDAVDGFSSHGGLIETGTAVSIGEADAFADLSVSPNPTTGVVNITLSDVSNGPAQIHITDPLGRSVQEAVLHGPTGTLLIDGPPGVYTLSLVNARSSVVQRVVKH
jgi:uncharacterized repeat protein (TIGR03803 family)